MRRGDASTPLAKGAELDAGDVVLTGATGHAQIRFTDGGLVALQPDSHFTVTRYVDSGDPAQDNFVVHLLRGGMRAVTGLIGKRNAANYHVVTPTAVVGIRGSAFYVTFNTQGQVVVAGEQDEIEVCTQAGCVGVKAGESVLVLSDQQLPVYTHTRALVPVPQPQRPDSAGEQVQTDGSRSSVQVTRPAPPPSGQVPPPPIPDYIPPPGTTPTPPSPPPPTTAPPPPTTAPPPPTTAPPPPTTAPPPPTTAPPPPTTAPPPPTTAPPPPTTAPPPPTTAPPPPSTIPPPPSTTPPPPTTRPPVVTPPITRPPRTP